MDEAYLTSNELLQEIQAVLFLEDGEELATATPAQDVHATLRDLLAYDGPLHVTFGGVNADDDGTTFAEAGVDDGGFTPTLNQAAVKDANTTCESYGYFSANLEVVYFKSSISV